MMSVWCQSCVIVLCLCHRPAGGVSEEESQRHQPRRRQRRLLQPPRRPALPGLRRPGRRVRGVCLERRCLSDVSQAENGLLVPHLCK